MANFNPYQFTNSHYPPDYSQYGDGLFSPFSSQMFSQDSQPSTSQPSFDRAFEHGQPIQPSPVPSAASGGTKKSNQRERWGFDDEKVGALFAREILRVDSPVSNIIYVPHVRPPRLLWRKCRDILVGQHMTRHKKKKATVRPLPKVSSALLIYINNM